MSNDNGIEVEEKFWNYLENVILEDIKEYGTEDIDTLRDKDNRLSLVAREVVTSAYSAIKAAS